MIFPPFWILKVADRNGKDNYASSWQKILKVFSIESPMEKKKKKMILSRLLLHRENGTGAVRYNENCSRMIKILLKRTPS